MFLFVILYIMLQSTGQNRDRRGRDRMDIQLHV